MSSESNTIVDVHLYYASIRFLRFAAVHHWFLIDDGNTVERWEVWQKQNAGGISRGHLHRNLKPPFENVRGGPTRLVQSWSGHEAEQIVKVLHDSWHSYPYLNVYRYIPGPNSNTYIAWVLSEAGVTLPLSRRAIGSRW